MARMVAMAVIDVDKNKHFNLLDIFENILSLNLCAHDFSLNKSIHIVLKFHFS